MRDDEIVAAIVAGDPAGVAAAYDRYAAPLYSYCLTLFRDPEDAADAVYDTFVVAASRLSRLRDPSRLRPWLYAVARNAYLRRRHGHRTQARSVSWTGTGAQSAQSRPAIVVRGALQGAGPGERDVLNLRLHKLDAEEQALVLGISARKLSALSSRAATQLPACLGVLLVASTGRGDCQELNAMLDGWDGWLTPRLRRKLTHHIERCANCTVRWHRELTPSIRDGAAVALTAAPPAMLRQQVIDAVLSVVPAAMSQRAAAARRAGQFSRGGFPPRRALQWRRRRVVYVSAVAAVAGAGAAAVIVVGVLHLVLPHAPSPAVPLSAPGHARFGASSGKTGGGGEASRARPTATRARKPPASPSASAAPPSPSPVQAPPPTAVAQGTVSVSPSTLTLTPLANSTFTITAHGGPVKWSVSGPPSLVEAVMVSQSTGSLAAGQSVTVTITEVSMLTAGSQITVSPGGEVITVLAGT